MKIRINGSIETKKGILVFVNSQIGAKNKLVSNIYIIYINNKQNYIKQSIQFTHTPIVIFIYELKFN